jgi:triphosphoribosyl-dephospho-CoA synthase
MFEEPDQVALAGQLAACLEVSAFPKPGNVHRLADSPETRYEQFLAGSIAIGPALREAAVKGIAVGRGWLRVEEVGVGELILSGVKAVEGWQRGGNTHLGIVMLFVPLAVGAGVLLGAGAKPDVEGLRGWASRVVGATTPQDAVRLYEAIRVVRPWWIGRLTPIEGGPPGVDAEDAPSRLLKEGWSLHRVLEFSASWDGVARELAAGYPVTFELGLPTLRQHLEETEDINLAVVHTFLQILAEHPDTFIARKVGASKTCDAREAFLLGSRVAEQISHKAKEVLEAGGLKSDKGRHMLEELDRELRGWRPPLNPGTSADLTASTLYAALLLGFRP